mmetsp:Transcript_7497/g.14652  ORF Transcript_7497/g.14652 Transcript_7497/m.14652 type:complete len:210 (-) Transcript_7497:105-734(-)
MFVTGIPICSVSWCGCLYVAASVGHEPRTSFANDDDARNNSDEIFGSTIPRRYKGANGRSSCTHGIVIWREVECRTLTQQRRRASISHFHTFVRCCGRYPRQLPLPCPCCGKFSRRTRGSGCDLVFYSVRRHQTHVGERPRFVQPLCDCCSWCLGGCCVRCCACLSNNQARSIIGGRHGAVSTESRPSVFGLRGDLTSRFVNSLTRERN